MFEHIGADNFIKKWPEVQNAAYVDRNIRIDEFTSPAVQKNEDIHDFLTFFKLIPSFRTNFSVAVSKFMAYSDVSDMLLLF